MRICDDQHDEICYEGRSCPCCLMAERITGLEKAIDSKQEEIDDLIKEQK